MDTVEAQAALDSQNYLELGPGEHRLEGLHVRKRQHIIAHPLANIRSKGAALVSDAGIFQASVTGGVWRCGTVWKHSSRSALQVRLSDMDIRGGVGFDVASAVGTTWRDCQFHSCDEGIAHRGVGAFNANRIVNCKFFLGNDGIRMGGNQAYGVLITGGWFEGLSGTGIAVGDNSASVTVLGAYFENNALDVDAATTSAIRQLVVDCCQFGNANHANPRITASGRSEVIVRGGTARLASGQALLSTSASYECRVERPTIHHIGTATGTLSYSEVVTGTGSFVYDQGSNDLGVNP